MKKLTGKNYNLNGNLFGYINPVTGEVSTHPPLCACGTCATPVIVEKKTEGN